MMGREWVKVAVELKDASKKVVKRTGREVLVVGGRGNEGRFQYATTALL